MHVWSAYWFGLWWRRRLVNSCAFEECVQTPSFGGSFVVLTLVDQPFGDVDHIRMFNWAIQFGLLKPLELVL